MSSKRTVGMWTWPSAWSAMGTSAGTVEFYDGTIDLGPGNLSGANPLEYTLNTPLLTLGDHSFTAVYSGDGTFGASTSPALVTSVTSGDAGTLTLTGSTTAINEGDQYTLSLPTTADSANITKWWINWGGVPEVSGRNPRRIVRDALLAMSA